MLKAAVINFFVEQRVSLRWWKIIVFLLFSLGLMVSFRETEAIRFWRIYILYWFSYILRPAESKINFLLPTDFKSRSFYLICRSVGLVLFLILWYLFIHAINIILHAYEIPYALKEFLCSDIIFILIVSLGSVLINYADKTVNYKISKVRLTVMILSLIYPTVHLAALYRMFNGPWLILSVTVAYLCLILAFFIFLDSMKETKIYYENIKKQVKWWA